MNLRHSIIIPHRNRLEYLRLCLWALRRSAEACGQSNYEIIVVDNRSILLPNPQQRLRVVKDDRRMPVFNKPMLLNRGMDEANGEVLTFLDADAVVGKEWMACQQSLVDDPGLTRLCYRGRGLPESYLVTSNGDLRERIDAAFGRYGRFPLKHEARGEPQTTCLKGEPLFGNSQFSIRRDVLGDLRWNEEYEGAGFEDMWMIREIWRRAGDGYRAVIPAEPQRSIFLIEHRQDQHDWRTDAALAANRQRYMTS